MIVQSQDVTPARTRVCRSCWEARPEAEFRLRRKDSNERHSECNVCHTAAEGRRRDARKARRFQKLAQDINRSRTPTEVLSCLSSILVHGLGGAVDFTVMWHEHLMIAAQERPGHRDVLNGFRAIVRLMEVAEAQRAKAGIADEFTSMSLEEIDAELMQMMTKLIVQQPAVVAEQMRRLGWTVVQPDGTC